MPFDFKKYDAKCAEMDPEKLQKEWEHYTRLISGAATSTTVSGLALPFTAGVSAIGVGMAAPAIHNARKKREIIEKHLQRHGTTHQTRKRDVLGSMAFSGTVGVVTLGVGSMGAEAVASHGAEHGISAIVNNETAIKIGLHAALDGAAMAGEEAHHNHLKEKDAKKMIAAAQQKIQLAQVQTEKPYGYQYHPGEPVYGAVQVPGSYSAAGQQVPMSEKETYQYQADVKYEYQVPPTPQYTPAPPPYTPGPGNVMSPTPSIAAPLPQYNPQHYAPPPVQTPGPVSPISAQQTGFSSQQFSPVSLAAQTPQFQSPAYVAPTHHAPQPAAQNLPPFQTHVAAPGAAPSAPPLVWSHVQNQWVAQETTAPPPPSASGPQEYGYPFPQQPAVDRRVSTYVSSPASASYSPSPSTPISYAATPAPQHTTQYLPPASTPHPTQAPYGQPTPAQTPGIPQYSAATQAPAPHAYSYPTPMQTPGAPQSSQPVTYFPPPPGAQITPHQQTSYAASSAEPQYAPVATPGPYQAPTPISQPTSHPQPVYAAPPTANSSQARYYHPPPQPQNQYSRHYSLPTPALTPGHEKMQQWPAPVPQHMGAAPPPHAPVHAATWGAPAPVGGAAPPPPSMQGLCDAYGGMKI